VHTDGILVVGAGATGAAVAHDLALRGLPVVIVERAHPVAQTSALHHGLVHSGARYAVVDPASARECAEESRILGRIAPGSVHDVGGLFVGLDEDEAAYGPALVDACRACGIDAQPVEPAEARDLEPGLASRVTAAVRVPDATTEPSEIPRRFLATARANGVCLRPHMRVVALLVAAGRVYGAQVGDRELRADVVVVAAGPWSEAIVRTAGARAPVQLSAGVMVALAGELSRRVLNRLRPPGDGDLVVPRGGRTVVGTSSFRVERADEPGVPPLHLEELIRTAAELLPGAAGAERTAAWSAVRPLLDERPDVSGREASRTFRCVDHAATDGIEGLVTIAGGKATTARAMAEAAADLVCAKLGVVAPCRTRDVELLPAEPL
jgi:glycerol-3-phosphate dehydrogenase